MPIRYLIDISNFTCSKPKPPVPHSLLRLCWRQVHPFLSSLLHMQSTKQFCRPTFQIYLESYDLSPLPWSSHDPLSLASQWLWFSNGSPYWTLVSSHSLFAQQSEGFISGSPFHSVKDLPYRVLLPLWPHLSRFPSFTVPTCHSVLAQTQPSLLRMLSPRVTLTWHLLCTSRCPKVGPHVNLPNNSTR